MIMRGTTPRALTASGVVLLLAVAFLLVPWLPTWGQGQPPASKEDANQILLDTLQKLKKMQADLQQRQATLEAERQAVEAKARDLAKALQAQAQNKEKKLIIEFEHKSADDNKKSKVKAWPPGTKEVDKALVEKIAIILMQQQGNNRPDLDRRLAELEKNLGGILREVQSMRRELQGGKGMQPNFGVPKGPQPGGPQAPGGRFGPPGNVPGAGPNGFGPPGGFTPPGPGAGPGGGFPQPPGAGPQAK